MSTLCESLFDCKVPSGYSLTRLSISIYTSLGDEFAYGRAKYSKEQVTEDQGFFKSWLNGEGLLSHMFSKGLLKPNRIKMMDGGIHSIQEGLDFLKAGKNSGEKLAYTISA